jgi:hypothetical protein
LAAACALGAACSSQSGIHGSPVLTQVYWVAGGQQVLAWSFDPSAALVSPLSPFGGELDFVFDRRLDGTKIEEIVTVNGVQATRPKDPPAVRVTWPDMTTAMSDPPFHLNVDYNSVPTFGGMSSYVFAHPDVPGFPASETLTVELVPTLLTSQFDEPAVVPASIKIKTGGFGVSSVASTAPVVPSYQLPLDFTNRLPAPPSTSPYVHVRARGADVPYKLLADSGLASRWFVAAADCLGGWPTGTTFEVTIDADFADAFGGKLGQAATETFTTSSGPAAAADASCSIPEAGTVDAGADAPPEASTDTPVDAGIDAVPAGADAGADAVDGSADTSAPGADAD